jgi:murein L,D-transpeptidase YcbB/YkuD
MPLKAFTSPPLGRAATDRLDKASRNSPALKFGERDSDGVRALQSALLLLEDPAIDIPAGVTGNFLDQTAAAVKAFQKRNRLAVDGVAGRQTITLLDSIMAHRGQRSLQRLNRVQVLNDLFVTVYDGLAKYMVHRLLSSFSPSGHPFAPPMCSTGRGMR